MSLLTALSVFAIIPVTASAAEIGGSPVAEPEETISDKAHLQSNVRDGVILHAFNWSYNAIKEKLPEIAAAGYSTVQTSPVQQPRDYSTSTDVAGQWWKLYQPVSMQIAQQSWLGTKAELTSLCSEADKYGIKIICEIVSNHFANMSDQAGANSLSDQVKTYQPDFYNNKSSYFRSNNLDADDTSVQKTVQGHVSNCPDLNTNNTNVQNAVLNLLKECIDCGVDGFYFDSAKNIETPGDGSYSSQYWPTVINGAKTYYQQKTGKNLFVYGEILNTCGAGRSFSNYTPYINVTDNMTGDAVLGAVYDQNAGNAAGSQYKSGVSADKIVLWAESHDTYEGTSGSAGLTNTSGVANETVVKAWAIVAARKDATALFFARPGQARMGEWSSDACYKSTAVAEVNKFHNLFVGQSEKLGYSGDVAYVQRGGRGIVLANVGGIATYVSIADTGLENGTYTDMVSGSEFTVSAGTLTGNIGSAGVAVIYNGRPTPRAASSSESCTFKGETITVRLTLENAVSGTFCIDDSDPVAFTDGTAIRIGSDYNYGETVTLTLTATDRYGTTETNVYKYKKEQNNGSGIYIWLNPAKKTDWKGPFSVWLYDDQTYGSSKTYTSAPERPGEAMSYDETQKMWYYEVPTDSYLNGQPNSFDLSKSSKAAFIISATNKTTNQTVQFPAANSSGIAPHQYLSGHSWEYAVTSGTSITFSTRVPTKVEIPAIEVTKDPPKYTIIWKNGDTVLKTERVEIHQTPEYSGEVPTKADDDDYTYTFSGWTDGKNSYGLSDKLPEVSDDATYTATYTKEFRSYTVNAAVNNDNGGTVTVSVPAKKHTAAWTCNGSAASNQIEYFSDTVDATVGDTVELHIAGGVPGAGFGIIFRICDENWGEVTTIQNTVFDGSHITNVSPYTKTFSYSGENTSVYRYEILGTSGMEYDYRGRYTLTVNWSEPSARAEARVNDEVTLNVTLNSDYVVKSVTARDAGNNNVEITNNKFTMPSGNVTVSVVFEKKATVLTITANDQTYTYNGNIQGPGDTGYDNQADIAKMVYVDGLQDGDMLVSILVDGQSETADAGVYSAVLLPDAAVIKRDGKDVTDRYDVRYVKGSIIIEPAEVTLTSGSGEKEYDGTPLTDSTVTVTGDGFAAGEGATYNVTGSQTKVGGTSGNNTFTYALNEGTKAGNYEITTVCGTLTVKANTTEIKITSADGEQKYSGSEFHKAEYVVKYGDKAVNVNPDGSYTLPTGD
ncbi:MAG: hypothetical protein ILO42_07290, partial [Clostridia bacterium]|nr:hypothetical protein [Clostridia bacterium]